MTRSRSPLPRRLAPWHWNWRWRITDNQWRKAMWERSAPVIVAAAVLVMIVGGGFGVWGALSSAHSSALAAQYGKTAAAYGQENKTLLKKEQVINNRHHMETQQQNKDIEFALAVIASYAKEIEQAQQDHAATLDEIDALAKQIAALQMQFNSIVGTLPAADAILTKFAVQVSADLNWIDSCLAKNDLGCGTPPPSPTF